MRTHILAVTRKFVVFAAHKQLAHVRVWPRIDCSDLKCIVFSRVVDQFPPNFPLRALGNRTVWPTTITHTNWEAYMINASPISIRYAILFYNFWINKFCYTIFPSRKLYRQVVIIASSIDHWKLFESSQRRAMKGSCRDFKRVIATRQAKVIVFFSFWYKHKRVGTQLFTTLFYL